MILSHTHKFIFFCNGKTGTTSIENALSPYQEGEEYNVAMPGVFYKKHVPPAIVKAFLPNDIWQNYFKFSFVRNPWDWVVSNWKYNFETLPAQRRQQHSLLRKVLNYKRGNYQMYRSRPLDVLSREHLYTLFDYLSVVKTLPSENSSVQWPFVYDIDGNKLVDYVGRFENLDDDFRAVCQRINLDITLPKLNVSNNRPYQTFYTDESKTLVSELWNKDIGLFKYVFDDSLDRVTNGV